jgi:sugar phosphate isomerase/epimerase
MAYSERIIGFSTGAVAKGYFERALEALRRAAVRAVELSALREQELPKLADSLKSLDLTGFEYVSVHAPTKFTELEETEAVRLLETAANRNLPIVVHPDSVQTFSAWNAFGSLLLVENMDKRKAVGRTADELKQSFEDLPNAGLCFDVAHARQVDPTMVESAQILLDFAGRLREVHASGVTTRSVHGAISSAAGSAYAGIAHLIPEGVPIILESPIEESSIVQEIEFARKVFSPWLERLLTDVDDVLDIKIDSLRRRQAENFLKILQMTRINLQDFEAVITHLPTGGPYNPGDVFLSARDLWTRLSDREKTQLQEHLLRRIREIAREYPELKSKFHEQFANV